jgi:hypothetical protein
MHIEVSIGEVVDKYSILQLKQQKIKDPAKLLEIDKELSALQECKKIIDDNKYYYKLLLYINDQIWRMTDQIKEMDPSKNTNEFAKLSKKIFDCNQKRFRIKRIFNATSNIKEQKSYAETFCKIVINDYETMLNKIPEINYLSIEYDRIILDEPYRKLIPHANANANANDNDNAILININDVTLERADREIYDF